MVVEDKRLLRGETTRQEILDAARALFGKEGYADASLQRVVAEAHVTKGALYHHFADKRALFLAVFEDVKRRLSHRVTNQFFGHGHYEPPEEPWRDVARWSEALLREYGDPQVQRICLVDAPAVLGWQEMRRLDERYEGVVLRAVLRSAMNRRTIERQALRPLTRMLTAALFECCLTIATAEDAAAAKAESWPVFVRIIDGLRVRTDG
ncbi:MAG: TetR/AcrR family transcriptional regulator [Polyangiales bacterium]